MPLSVRKKTTPSEPSKKISESKIQAKIANDRRRDGWIVIKLGTTAPGMPDLMCLKNGVTEFIEVKRLGAVRSPLQKKVAMDLERQGFKVLCLTQDGAIVLEEPLTACADVGF